MALNFGSRKVALYLLGALLCLVAPVKADDYAIGAVGPFGGLNNTDSSLVIPANKAQDLLNVDITPGGKSVKKRSGYGLAATLTVSTSPVHGVYTFYDSNGNTVDLYFNDRYMSSSVNNGSVTTLFSTGTFGATYQCVDSQGYAYCNNTARTTLTKTDGATYSSIKTVNSTGTLVAVTQQRLVTAGFSEAPNRIDFSKANDFSTWTVGPEPTDPVQYTIVSPGSHITHIVYAFGRIIWFKDSSFGYVLEGDTQDAWQIRVISPNVGTLDNSSIYWQGILYFRGQDGHIYGYDGSNYQKMTRDLEGTISASQSRTSNSWSQTTAADWGAGTFDTSVYVDTETNSGTLQTEFPDSCSTIRDGTSGTKTVWVSTNSLGTLTASAATGECAYSINAAGFIYLRLSNQMTLNPSGTTFYFKITALNSAAGGSEFYFGISNQLLDSSNHFAQDLAGPSDQTNLFADFLSTAGVVEYNQIQFKNVNSSTFSQIQVSPSNSMESGGGIWKSAFPATVALFISSTRLSTSFNGTIVASSTHTLTTGGSWYVYFQKDPGAVAANFTIDDFSISPETFTYLSPVHNVTGAISAWDSFSATYAGETGSHTFSIRSATYSFLASDSSPAWTSITPGTLPTISTGSYVQNRDAFNYFAATVTSPVQLSDFTDQWFEGSATDKAYATYFKDALWWSVASGAGATTNNRILRYDFQTSDWVLYDIATDGMLVRNNNLYFGSATEGKIFKFGAANNDNGAAINAYWTSKDFFGDSPFVDKEIVNLSVAAASVQNSNINITYTLNGETDTSYTVSLYDANKSVLRSNKNLPQGKIGNTFRIKFGNDAADQPFEVFAIQYGLREKPWVPSR